MSREMNDLFRVDRIYASPFVICTTEEREFQASERSHQTALSDQITRDHWVHVIDCR